MANRSEASGAGRPTVGIVGAGQLARMSCEAASALGISTVVLAERADDSAAEVAGRLLLGGPASAAEMAALAQACDVVTFDHEQVDLSLVADLEEKGHAVHPGPATLEMAVDKGAMRRIFAEAGLPQPSFSVLEPGLGAQEAARAVGRFAGEHGWPVVLKAARGGYDGKGVWPLADQQAADEVCREARAAGIELLVEEMVAIEAELAVLLARDPEGRVVAWPAVETAQIDGVCREVLVPGRLEEEILDEAQRLGRRVADVAGSVGVLAVELFLSGGALTVNEIAARPHNSGHWTIEGAVTSQFENHLRAVLGLPLGATDPTAPAVASVNVFGGPDGSDPRQHLGAALAVPGAHVHLYAKAARPGRKLGHVTVVGEDPVQVRHLAWQAATALGTPVPAELSAPVGGGR